MRQRIVMLTLLLAGCQVLPLQHKAVICATVDDKMVCKPTKQEQDDGRRWRHPATAPEAGEQEQKQA